MSIYDVIQSFIATYGEGRLETLKLLVLFIKERNKKFGRNSLCLTYEGLRKWMTYRKVRKKFTTVERDMRKLAEKNILRRKFTRNRKNVIFCLNPEHPVVQYLLSKLE